MIEIGKMFNKIIPFDTLCNMPVSFVHHLRDIRCEQLKQEAKAQEEQMNNSNWANNSQNNGVPVVPRSVMDELDDELS